MSSDAPEIGKVVTHVLNPKTHLWDRIRPLDLYAVIKMTYLTALGERGRTVAGTLEAHNYALLELQQFGIASTDDMDIFR